MMRPHSYGGPQCYDGTIPVYWYGGRQPHCSFLIKIHLHHTTSVTLLCHTDHVMERKATQLCHFIKNLHSNPLSKDITVLTKMKLTYWRKDQKCKKAVFDKVSPSLARRPLPGAANKIVITYHYTSIHCTGRCLTSVSGRYFLLYIVSVVL